MSDPERVLLYADNDREPVTVQTLDECHRAVDDLTTGGSPVAMSTALAAEWEQDRLEEQALLVELGHFDQWSLLDE